MTTFSIDDAGALRMDVEALIDSRMLIQANSGGSGELRASAALFGRS
jgi:hypothetical protein